MTDRPTKPPRGRLAVVSSINDAERELELKKRGRDDPPPTQPRGGIKPNRKGAPPNWTANWLGLPKEEPCPVVPLGTEQIGGAIVYHMLSSNGHFVSYAASDFSHAGMQSLFGATPNYPAWAWPRHGKPYKIKNADGAEEQDQQPRRTVMDEANERYFRRMCEDQGSPTFSVSPEFVRSNREWDDRVTAHQQSGSEGT